MKITKLEEKYLMVDGETKIIIEVNFVRSDYELTLTRIEKHKNYLIQEAENFAKDVIIKYNI